MVLAAIKTDIFGLKMLFAAVKGFIFSRAWAGEKNFRTKYSKFINFGLKKKGAFN